MQTHAHTPASKSPSGTHTATRASGMPSADLKVLSMARLIHAPVQTKLVQDKSRDPHEKEADEVADHVMATGTAGQHRTIRRLPGIQRKEEEKEKPAQKSQEKKVQARLSSGVSETHVPSGFSSTIASSPSGGHGLPAPVLEKMEHAFGTGFGHVRVHTDTASAGLSDAIHAQAFTTGHHIYFNRNRYQPGTAGGQHLIAHELTHVVQQGHARAAGGKISSAAGRPQRLGIGIGAAINRFVRYIPGWELFTYIIGFNPLLGQRVARNATNLLGGILGLVPVFGTLLFDKLQEHHVVDRAYNWLLGELSRFGLTRQSLEQIITDTYNRIQVFRLDAFEYNRNLIVNAFADLYDRVTRFASSVGRQILDFLKEALLERLRRVAAAVPGYDILTMILGQDPLTGQAVARDTAQIIERFLILIGQRDHVRKMRETGTLQRAADWIDAQLALLNFSFSEIQNLFVTAWNRFSFADLRDPIGAFRRTVGIFTPFVSRVARFAWNVARQVLIFIKEVLISALTRFARRVPGYLLLSVILGRDPISGSPVPRTPANFIGGFMEFVPGGRERFQNLQASGAIDRMFAWLEQQVIILNLSFAILVQLFTRAWQSLSISDLMHPIETFQRMADLFGPTILRIIRFALAVGEKILEFVFEGVMGAGGARVLAIIRQARSSFMTIIRNPIGFLGNLINAVVRGFRQFSSNILTHLRNGLIGWLMGALNGTGLVLPQRFDLRGILSIVLQVMGLTYARIRPRLVRALGEQNVARLERAYEFIRTLLTEGPAGIWRQILERIDNLQSMVFEAIRNWVITRIVISAVTRIASMFNPAGAVIQAILAIYNTIMFFIERINQILALVESIVRSIGSIASGNISAAADFVEQSMGRAVPVIISFLARLLGLGGIGTTVMRLIRRVQGAVSRAIDRVLAWVIPHARRFLGRVGGAVRRGAAAIRNFIYPRHRFRSGNSQHTISFSNNTPSARVMVASAPTTLSDLLTHAATLPENRTRRHIIQSARTKETELTGLQTQLSHETNDAVKEQIRAQIHNKIRSIASDLAMLLEFEDFATETNPLLLDWPKPRWDAYRALFFGPRTSQPVTQSVLGLARSGNATAIAEVESKALNEAHRQAWENSGYRIREFRPAGSRALDDLAMGVRPPYRVRANNYKFKLPARPDPSRSRQAKHRATLMKYGFNSSESGNPMDIDHVLELQMGGRDIDANLWPLNSAVNRSSGSQLRRKIFDVPGTGRVPMSVLKQRAATQDVWIKIVSTL